MDAGRFRREGLGAVVKATLTAGQRDYEARRAQKAGMTLEKWLASKERAAEADARAKAKAAEPAKPAKPPGMLRRLIDRAHEPLKPEPKKGPARAGAVKAGVVKAGRK